jgi:hypothetical protein
MGSNKYGDPYGGRNSNNNFQNDDNSAWRRSSNPPPPPSQMSYGRYNNQSNPIDDSQRPTLKLDPRSRPIPSNDQNKPMSNSTTPVNQQDQPQDKWANVFAKSSAPRPSFNNGQNYNNDESFGGGRGSNSYGRPGWRNDGEPSGGSWGNSYRGDSGGFNGDDRGNREYRGPPRGNYNRNNNTDEYLDNPRFASAFAGASKGSESRPASTSATNYPTLKSSKPEGPTSNATDVSAVKNPKDSKAEEAKAAKQAKDAARAEAKRLAKEQREKEEARKAAELEAREVALASQLSAATACYNSKVKGKDLTTHIEGLADKPSAASLVKLILENAEDILTKWFTKEEYGDALVSLTKGNQTAMVDVLYEVQEYCHGKNFPKITVKDKSRKLVDLLFQLLYKYEIVDDQAIFAWADDENDVKPGKSTALVHTTELLLLLRDEGEEEYEEDDEVDAPREIVK